MPNAHTSSAPAEASRSRKLIMAAVLAVGICGLPTMVHAQHRVPQEGDALDANTRVGSGGSNRAPGNNPVNDRYRLGNNVVTGNVTGGRAFRGPILYGSDRDFRDFTGLQPSSHFAGISTGVSGSGQIINNSQFARPYYGGAQVVNPPADFARVPGTGGYVPQTALEPTGGRLDLRRTTPLSGGATSLNTQVELNLGDFSQTNDLGPLVTRPGLGITDLGLDGGRALSPYTRLERDMRLEPLTPGRIADLRSELLRDEQGNPASQDQLQGLARPLDTGADRRVDAAPQGSEALTGTAGTMQQQMDAAFQRTSELHLADPAEQSTQYAQLLERLDRFRALPVPEGLRPLGADPRPETATPPTQEERATPESVERQPAEGVPGLPSFIPPPRSASPLQPRETPLELRSLAEGVSSPTLARMYEQAEQLMAEGRFVSAIARYDVAERLVPNQPLTMLGRSMAEIGAGYFRRASDSLRVAFSRNPELLMAKLDVPQFIGQERFAEVDQTLRQRLDTEPNNPDSAFLLGFLAYHAGDPGAASEFLQLATARSGDPFYAEVARHWGLDVEPPQGAPATQPASLNEPG